LFSSTPDSAEEVVKMKITVKTLQQKIFTLEAEESATIGDLKTQIQQIQGHQVDQQKLIYSGKVLADSKTVGECGIKEKDFLVLMVAKPKPAAATSSTPAAATSAPPSAAPSQPSVVPSQVPPVAPPAAPSPAPATPAAPPSAPASASPQATPAAEGPNDPNSLLTGTALQSAINNMVEMGFPKEQVLRAMRASFNNPDRAVEYLFNGIPAHLEEPQPAAGAAAGGAGAQPEVERSAAAAAPAPQVQPNPPSTGQPQNLFQLAQQQQQLQQAPRAPGFSGSEAAAGGGAGMNLAALQNNPQLQQLRELMQQNPELIQPLVQQLAQANPHLAQLLAQHPEAIFQLLGADDDGDGEGLPEGPIPPGTQILRITPEERAAIERLEALGFSRQAVIEAYFACDKNEELAANYLFEGGFQDD